MTKPRTHTHPIRVALLLIVVFMSSLLIQPVHGLLAHHDAHQLTCTPIGSHILTNQTSTDCPICNFEFCLFIPQKIQKLVRHSVMVFKQLTERTVTLLTPKTHPLFHLRAPPVF